MKRKKNAGFTLVEVVVVLVILALLAALLVPNLKGWIDQGRQKAAIVECKHNVMAAQSIGLDLFASGTKSDASGSSGIIRFNDIAGKTVADEDAASGFLLAVQSQAETDQHAQTITMNNKGTVSRLEYLSTSGITVIYENGEYHIKIEESSPVYMTFPEFAASDILLDFMQDDSGNGFWRNGQNPAAGAGADSFATNSAGRTAAIRAILKTLNPPLEDGMWRIVTTSNASTPVSKTTFNFYYIPGSSDPADYNTTDTYTVYKYDSKTGVITTSTAKLVNNNGYLRINK